MLGFPEFTWKLYQNQLPPQFAPVLCKINRDGITDASLKSQHEASAYCKIIISWKQVIFDLFGFNFLDSTIVCSRECLKNRF